MKNKECETEKLLNEEEGNFCDKLSKIDLVITNDLKYSIALKYPKGMTPIVIYKCTGSKSIPLILAASKLDIPVIELLDLEESSLKYLEIDKEIPEILYKNIAQAYALIRKSRPGPQLVRLLKILPEKTEKNFKKIFDEVKDIIKIEEIGISVGSGLYLRKAELVEKLKELRQKIALDLGMVIPDIKIEKEANINNNCYTIYFKGAIWSKGEIDQSFSEKDAFSTIIKKVKDMIYLQPQEFLSLSMVENIIGNIKKFNPKLVKELFPKYFTLSGLKIILRNLLEEGISIRDVSTILEVIKENLAKTSDPDYLTEYIRSSFRHLITNKYKDKDGAINVLLLSPEIEIIFNTSLKITEQVKWMELPPQIGLQILIKVGEELENLKKYGLNAVILCSPVIRRFARMLTSSSFPELPVIAYSEIAPLTKIRSVGFIQILKNDISKTD